MLKCQPLTEQLTGKMCVAHISHANLNLSLPLPQIHWLSSTSVCCCLYKYTKTVRLGASLPCPRRLCYSESSLSSRLWYGTFCKPKHLFRAAATECGKEATAMNDPALHPSPSLQPMVKIFCLTAHVQTKCRNSLLPVQRVCACALRQEVRGLQWVTWSIGSVLRSI